MENFASAAAQNWYSNLVEECNTLAEKIGLNDEHLREMRDFVFKIAKQQYQVGNKSGIRWAFRKREEEARQTQAVAAA